MESDHLLRVFTKKNRKLNVSNVPVWFDNFEVKHVRGRLIEENHYYPYGLKIAAISSRAVAGSVGTDIQKLGYQGAYGEEVEEFDLGYSEFQLRNYDPQIGRFMNADPFCQYASPYLGMGNDPANLNDPTGGFTLSMLGGAALGAVIGAGIGALASGGEFEGIAAGAFLGAALGGTICEDGVVIGTSTLKLTVSAAISISGNLASVNIHRSIESVADAKSGSPADGGQGGNNNLAQGPEHGPNVDGNTPYYKQLLEVSGSDDSDPNNQKGLFDRLWDNYTKVIHMDSRTKKDRFDNHSAINLSDALKKSGVEMSSFKGSKCGDDCKHATVATELSNWLLKNKPDGSEEPVVLTGKTFQKYINGKQGIIYFEDYWQRPGETGNTRTGDHIDLWGGHLYASLPWYRSLTRTLFPRASERWQDLTDLSRSKRVLFWEFKK